MKSVLIVYLLFALLLAGCSSPQKESPPPAAPPPAASTPATPVYEEVTVENAGTVSGTVKFAGAKPKLAPRPVSSRNPEVCGHGAKPSEEVLSGEGGALRNVVVYIDGIKKGKKMPSANPVLDQKKCDYIPHVQAVAAGSTLDILNSDDLLHNVHGKLNGRETIFNYAMPLKGQKFSKQLPKPGVINLQCDAGHTWMKAYIVVVDNPYYQTTDSKGSFALTDVPPGDYRVKAWHEKYGVQEQNVTVSAGGDSKVTFEFKPAG
jgi:plastocyanin